MEGYDLVVNGVSFVEKYGSGVVEYERPAYETKDVPTNDWCDEDGEDALFPEGGLVFKGGELRVKMCYSGKYGSWDEVSDSMLRFLRSSVLKVVDGFSGKTYYGCYFKGMSDEDVWCDKSAGDVVTYTLGFRVTQLMEERA